MENNFERLVRDIEEYDSDTFFARGVNLKPEEARKIADMLVGIWSNQHLDGVIIDQCLETIRDNSGYEDKDEEEEEEND